MAPPFKSSSSINLVCFHGLLMPLHFHYGELVIEYHSQRDHFRFDMSNVLLEIHFVVSLTNRVHFFRGKKCRIRIISKQTSWLRFCIAHNFLCVTFLLADQFKSTVQLYAVCSQALPTHPQSSDSVRSEQRASTSAPIRDGDATGEAVGVLPASYWLQIVEMCQCQCTIIYIRGKNN